MKNLFNRLSILFLLLYSAISMGATAIQPGAAQLNEYLPLLNGKRVAVFANQTSMVGQTHLIDLLLKHNVNIVKIFVPEHGFRGTAADGETIHNSIDKKTGIPIVSLYGSRMKPNAQELSNVDIIVFDIQDVGVRFYTFISSLQRVMEAAVENDKNLIVLDRPNPNGFYVDGPVLNLKFKTFTGMQPVPVVYGMTMGEYAKMLVGEEWLKLPSGKYADELRLTVISCKNYTHKSLYEPPVRPSPNLPNIQSIYWYPTIGMFEATPLSVGRGTYYPFQIFGHPLFKTKFTFIPEPTSASPAPPYKGIVCHGWHLPENKQAILKDIHGKLQIKYIIKAYEAYPDKKHFFQGFRSMAGTDILEKQIKEGLSENEIRKSWEPELSEFKKIRQKYLMYPDFS